MRRVESTRVGSSGRDRRHGRPKRIGPKTEGLSSTGYATATPTDKWAIPDNLSRGVDDSGNVEHDP